MKKVSSFRFIRNVAALLVATIALTAVNTQAADEKGYDPAQYSFRKIFIDGAQDGRWAGATSNSERLIILRSAIKHWSASDTKDGSISPRYVVTCYGGVIDMRHFLLAAAAAASGTKSPDEIGYDSMVSEGGMVVPSQYHGEVTAKLIEETEDWAWVGSARADDIPSDALGAYWGRSIASKNGDVSFDLEGSFIDFISPFIPVPNAVTAKLTFHELVLGYSESPSRAELVASQLWLTARPKVFTKRLNAVAKEVGLKPLCDDVDNGDDALAKAGFRVEKVAGQYPVKLGHEL